MSLYNPASFFERRQPAQEGVGRTLIVLGAARSGTTMISKMLHDMGVSMGENLKGTFHDREFDQICRSLYHGKIDISHDSIRKAIEYRNLRYSTWGWKFPSLVFPELYSKTNNPHLICIFRDPVAVAARESASQGLSFESCFRRALKQAETIYDYASSTDYPCLFVSYERAMGNKAEIADELAHFSGIHFRSNLRQIVIEGITPKTKAYIEASRSSKIEGSLDRSDRYVAGWLRYTFDPMQKVFFSAYVDDIKVFEGFADMYRKDLADAFGSDGRHSFVIELPINLIDGKKHSLSIYVDDGKKAILSRDFVSPPSESSI